MDSVRCVVAEGKNHVQQYLCVVACRQNLRHGSRSGNKKEARTESFIRSRSLVCNANFHRVHACNLFNMCPSAFLPHLSFSNCLCADGLLLSAKTCPFDVRLEHAILLAFLRDIFLVWSCCLCRCSWQRCRRCTCRRHLFVSSDMTIL